MNVYSYMYICAVEKSVSHEIKNVEWEKQEQCKLGWYTYSNKITLVA